MTEFAYDHVHLRSPDPDATAAYYERMFGAEIIKSVMSNGIPRTDIKLGGVMFFSFSILTAITISPSLSWRRSAESANAALNSPVLA